MIRDAGLRFKFGIAVGLAAAMLSVSSFGQSKYPERSIRMVVPFAPGGNTDIVTRIYAAKMTPLLGQQMLVDNKAGADGAIGSAEVARAKPDGYTLLMGTASTHSINPLTMDKPGYDPVKDFAGIAILSTTPIAVAVHPNLPKTLQELIKRVKADPGKYSYGTAGVGSLNHLTGELFKIVGGGLDIVHVPYKGGGPSVQDLIAGQIPTAFVTFSSAVVFHRNGRLRILAVFSNKRSQAAPDIPTSAEAGLPGVLAYTYTAVLVPAGTPRAIVDQLYQATSKVVADSGFQKSLFDQTAELVTDSNPGNTTQFLREEIEKWAGVLKAIGGKGKVH